MYKLDKHKNWIKFFYFQFYKYYRTTFGSLIFKGFKLKSFNLLNNLKILIKSKFKNDPNLIFILSLYQITPNILLYPFKIGGKLQGVPLFISWRKKWSITIRWIVSLLKNNKKNIKLNEFFNLISLSLFNKGLAIQKKNFFNNISNKNRYLMKFFK